VSGVIAGLASEEACAGEIYEEYDRQAVAVRYRRCRRADAWRCPRVQQQLFVDLGGYADSPDKVEWHQAIATAVARIPGATLASDPNWRGYYFASGGAKVIRRLLAAGDPLLDDLPMARHLGTSLTTVRQPVRELGTVAFEPLFAMINRERPASRDVVLPTMLGHQPMRGFAPGEMARRQR